MAFLQKPLNDDDDNENESNGGGASQPVNISGSEAANDTPGTVKQQNVASPQATKSGSFQNIQSYLDANAGFNGGQGLAGKTYDTLKDQKDQQQNAIGSANSEFQKNSTAAGDNYDPSKVSSFVNGVIQDPTKASDSDVNQYQSYLNAEYNGPNSLKGYGDLSSQAQSFNQTTGLTNSEPGRMALLQKLYNNGSYNQGQQSLDNLLISADANQLQKLQSAQSFGNQVQNDLNSAQNNAQTDAQKYQNWANEARQKSGTALSDSATTADKALEDKASGYKSTADESYTKILGDIKSGILSDEDNQLMGNLNPDQVKYLYGIDPTQFLNKSLDPTAGQVADQTDVDKFAALAKLAGSYNPNIGNLTSKYSQTGNYDPNKAVNYDSVGLLNAINDRNNNFNTNFQHILGTPVSSTSNGVTTNSPGLTTNADIDQTIKNLASIIDSNRSHPNAANQNIANNAQQYIDLLNKLAATRGSGLTLDSASPRPTMQSPTSGSTLPPIRPTGFKR